VRSPGNGNSMFLWNIGTKHARCCKNPQYNHPLNYYVHLTFPPLEAVSFHHKSLATCM
jgi:hypothetical protein